LAPWTSTDGLAWQQRGGLDLSVWKAALAAYDSENPDADSHDNCTFTVIGFEEGPANLLLRGEIDCSGGCGGSVLSAEAMWTSADALVWSPVDMPRVFGNAGIGTISGGSAGFVALEQPTSGQQTLWASSDGQAWRQGKLPTDALKPGSWAYDPSSITGGFVLPGYVLVKAGAQTTGGSTGGCVGMAPTNDSPPLYRGAIWWSPDGTTWTRDSLSGTTDAPNVFMRVLRVDNHTLVATQQASTIDGTKVADAAWVSRDGRTWTPLGSYPTGGGAAVAGRDHGLIYTMKYSTSNGSSVSTPTFYVIDSHLNLVALRQTDTPPQMSSWQMALGPAGLLVTDDGARFWIGALGSQ
jgi:hypothetical protein